MTSSANANDTPVSAVFNSCDTVRPASVTDELAAGPAASLTVRNGSAPSATDSVTRRRLSSAACVNVPQAGAADQKQENFSASGAFRDNLAQADPEKKKAFIESITSGEFHNQAALGAESALTAMMGREAAYHGHEMTWESLLKTNEHWESGIDLTKLA